MNEKKPKQRGKKVSFRSRLRYAFDNIMSRGTMSKVLLLLIFSCVVIIILAFIDYEIEKSVQKELTQTIWDTLNHTFDPGNLYGDERSSGSLTVMLIATLFGMFFTATLISIINNGLENRMESLSRGKSKVLETKHTILLGFSEITYTILGELIRANENKNGRQVIVVMDSSHEKAEMEDAIYRHIPLFLSDLSPRTQRQALKHTRIVCRKGHIYSEADLNMCSIDECQSIIINSSDDAHTVKAIMACAAAIDRIQAKNKGRDLPYITAVVMKRDNMDSAIIAGRGHLEVVCYGDIMSRIIASSSRSPGLSYVFSEIFDYVGNECYSIAKDDIVLPSGVSFADLGLYDVNQYLKDGILIGGYKKGDLKGISVVDRLRDPFKTTVSCLMPTMPYTSLEEPDHFYILENDDDPLAVCANQHGTFRPPLNGKVPEEKSHYVVIGNGTLIMIVLNRLNDFLPEGTPVTIITYPSEEEFVFIPERGRSVKIQIQTACVALEDYFSLSEVLPEDATSVLVLADDPDEKDEEIAEKEERPVEDVIDERTLSRLIFLRQIREDRNASFNITCEINLDRNRQLAEYTGTEDFIVGSRISALLITQISQTRSLHRLYMELLDPFGTEFYFRRAADYMDLTDPEGISIYDALAACAAHNEVFIGLRLEDRNVSGKYKRPLINPPKWENNGSREVLKRYHLQCNDLFIVLAEGS